MISNIPQHYKIYNIAYYIYVFCGFWQYHSSVNWKMNFYVTYKFVVIFVYTVGSFCFIADAYQVRNDVEKLSFNMTSSFLIIGTMTKITMLSLRRHAVEKSLKKMNNNFGLKNVGVDEEDENIFKEAADGFFKINRVFYIILTFGLPLRVISNTAFKEKTYMIPIPFKEELRPIYELVYTGQFILTVHFLVTVIAHDMLVYGIILRYITHLSVIKKNIIKIKKLYPKEDFKKYIPEYIESEDDNPNVGEVLITKENHSGKIQKLLNNYGFDKRNVLSCVSDKEAREQKTFQTLRDIVIYHQIVIEEMKIFFKIYSQPLFITMSFASLLIGAVALQIIMIAEEITPLLIQQVVYVATALMNILYLCSFGSDLTDKSEKAADALYDVPWYEMDHRNRYVVQFILKVLISPPKIKAGGIIIINRKTFLSLLQNSYNMVAVLKNF